MSVTCGRSVVSFGYSVFLHQQNWPPRYNWNIVESGIKHHSMTVHTDITRTSCSIYINLQDLGQCLILEILFMSSK